MTWQPGHQLLNGEYVIEREIGRGGFGIVYLARDRNGSSFAIKTVNKAWLDSNEKLTDANLNFGYEGKRMQKCQHPNIVKIYSVNSDNSLVFIVMEYISGETLENYVKRQGALAEDKALRYIQQIGEALIEVHKKALLHRDVNPRNIMLRSDGETVVLLDFGSTREFIRNQIETYTVLLSEGYAPPEQYLKNARRGEYTDVYALAATLYFLLTGEKPLSALERERGGKLEPPKQLNPKISDRTNRAILKGMALDAKNRPQSVQEWLKQLQPPPSLQSIQKWWKTQLIGRRKFILAAVGLLIALLLALLQQIIQPSKPSRKPTTTTRRPFNVKKTDRAGNITLSRSVADFYTVDLGNGVSLEMVSIPDKNFRMGRFPITQAQWKAVAELPQVNRPLNPNPSTFSGEDLPVETVSWDEAMEFCARLTKNLQVTYRLPSEAEWQYACRANTNTPFYFGETITPELANYDYTFDYLSGSKEGEKRVEASQQYIGQTTPVGRFYAPNDFGLEDMHGNVWEWCADSPPGDNQKRVLRGGAWHDFPTKCTSTSTSRKILPQNIRTNSIGFRVVWS